MREVLSEFRMNDWSSRITKGSAWEHVKGRVQQTALVLVSASQAYAHHGPSCRFSSLRGADMPCGTQPPDIINLATTVGSASLFVPREKKLFALRNPRAWSLLNASNPFHFPSREQIRNSAAAKSIIVISKSHQSYITERAHPGANEHDGGER